MTEPPDGLVRSLLAPTTVLADLEWHESVGSTNDLAFAAASRGAGEVHAVVADEQTAGRGRRGRAWQAPSGSSLLVSLLLRPTVAPARWGLLPLLVGEALSRVVAPLVPRCSVGLKWPNDVLVDGRKAAGILVEARHGVVVVGMGVNVDWRGVARPDELAGAVSLAEAAGGQVDRWRLLAAFVGVFSRAYRGWSSDPGGFLSAYRGVCATLELEVAVQLADGTVRGRAVEVDDDGALLVETNAGDRVPCVAGDVVHVRPT